VFLLNILRHGKQQNKTKIVSVIVQCDCPYNKRLYTTCNKLTLGPKRQTIHIGIVCTWNSFVSIFTIFPLSVRTMKHANLVRLYTRTAESNFVCDFNICLVILKLLRRPDPPSKESKTQDSAESQYKSVHLTESFSCKSNTMTLVSLQSLQSPSSPRYPVSVQPKDPSPYSQKLVLHILSLW
jgi:hypothetical protein